MQNQTEDDSDILDLDALDKPVGRARSRGKLYPILPANARVMELIQGMGEQSKAGKMTAVEQLATTRLIVAEAVPSMSDDDIKSLSLDKMLAIVTASSGNVDEVRKMIRNAEGNGSAPSAARKPAARSKRTTSGTGRRSSTQ